MAGDAVTTCAGCGAGNRPGAVFCASCDRLLQWDGTPAPVREAAPVRTPPPAQELAPVHEPAREPVPEPAPPPPPAPSPHPQGRPDIHAALQVGQQLAAHQGRPDLGRHLDQARVAMTGQPVPVVVVGEFKRGKSTLVNALLQSAVCPVDADLVTAVPTTVRWAPTPTLTSLVRTDDGEVLQQREVDLDRLTMLVTEQADPSDPERQRAVEVGLPHRMLKSGLQLVDTPGVGGLDSAHGFLTLGALRAAKGVLFVTDAAQELTGPELAFLRTTVERCPVTALVVTKIDLYPHWRRIVELDRGHLDAAGLSVPIIPLSSFLRLRAQRDPELNAESGFAELVTFLGRDVVARGRDDAARLAAQEVEFVAAQLDQQAEAERTVLARPEQTPVVVARLEQAAEAAGRLASPGASWQQVLADGVQDLFAEVEHDLQSRLRAVLAEVDQVLEEGDPQETWSDTEVWLRRQVAMATEANRDLLTERATDLADQVATQFDLQAGTQVRLGEAPQLDLTGVTLATKTSLKMPGGRLAPLMMAARTSLYLPMMMGSVAASMLTGGLPVHLAIAGISLALGAGIGRKVIKDEHSRQRTYRQQQAKAAARRFIDEVAFLANKQTRDGLRNAQRQLRDDFQRRALMMQGSAAAARTAAERAARLSGTEQQAREVELAAEREQLARVRGAARELVGAGSGG